MVIQVRYFKILFTNRLKCRGFGSKNYPYFFGMALFRFYWQILEIYSIILYKKVSTPIRLIQGPPFSSKIDLKLDCFLNCYGSNDKYLRKS